MNIFNIVKSLIYAVFGKFTPLVFAIIIAGIVLGICIIIKEYKVYKKGTYYQDTKLPYLHVKFDLGRNGEYMTYRHLKSYENNGAKFLFNVYIPKDNGETTELDVVMISKTGIFVFESKNYSGWIFGTETQQYWYQTLPTGKGKKQKNKFFNPVLQNRSHIKHLQLYLNFEKNFPIYSIIVFSERCTLKNINMKSPDIHVIKRDQLVSTVNEIYLQPTEYLSAEDIQQIYDKLYQQTQVDEQTKLNHIANIQKKQSTVHTNTTVPVHSSAPTADSTTSAADDTDDASAAEPLTAVPQTEESENKVCPLCGAALVLRTVRKSTNAGKQFYGCSTFPKCRYTQNID